METKALSPCHVGTAKQRRPPGRKLCFLPDGRCLTFKDKRYYCDGNRMHAEAALILLSEECKRVDGLQHRLRLALPTDDYRIINGDELGWSSGHLIPEHEFYLVRMMTATEPPPGDWEQDYEAVHRAALPEDLSDSFLRAQIPLLLRFVWHPRFGDAIRNHLFARTPLSRWRVTTQLLGSKPHESASALNLETGGHLGVQRSANTVLRSF